MRYYILESDASRRFKRFQVKRMADGEIVGRHDHYEEAKAQRDQLQAEAQPREELKALVVTPNPNRRR